MSYRQNILVDHELIGWLTAAAKGTSGGPVLSGPYTCVSSENIHNFSIGFSKSEDGWTAQNDDIVAIILVQHVPTNGSEYQQLSWICCDDPRALFALLTHRAAQRSSCRNLRAWHGLPSTSFVHPSARISPSAVIEPNVWIGPGVTVGPNSTIGGPGFGFGRIGNSAARLTHSGGVYISGECVISANCTIASGTFRPTVVGRRVWMDDQVHVAHNCHIGDDCTLTAGAVLAGSVTLDGEVWLGPNSAINNGVTLGKGVFVGVGAVVAKSVESGRVAGNPARALRSS